MSSAYCTKSNAVDIFGNANITAWSDIDNDGNAATIAARIARGIVVVSDKIDDVMRRSPYRIPLTTPAGATPTAIVDIAAKLLGVWLYTPRGVEDFTGERPIHMLTPIEDDAKKELEEIRSGRKPIDAL